jgi:hypothetical protein
VTKQAFAEYFILALPYVMAAAFVAGLFFRAIIYFTVRRHEWFAKEFEKRVNRYMEAEVPGKVKDVSFYVLSKRMLERTYYELFEVRDRMKRRKPDGVMSASDRIFLIRQGCAWLVRDILKQVKFLKWTEETPKLLNITKATFQHNPCFNRVFGVFPMEGLNELISILPGLFVVAGILGTFVIFKSFGVSSVHFKNFTCFKISRTNQAQPWRIRKMRSLADMTPSGLRRFMRSRTSKSS